MIAHIQLEFESKEEAKRILATIVPDNYPLPNGLQIECSVSECSLNITIHSDRSVESLGATLEDMMSAIDLSIRTSDTLES